mmetsp:Transcript_7695/g.8930  ORF Transcript_7695/g.8930 Transcript_7695/m.8930 type:complete len:117 (+) Transcript_7695:118-468(+)
MSIPVGPKLELIEATETTISVQYKPISSIDKYGLEWKQIEHQWTKPAGNTTLSVQIEGKMITGEAINLDPGMTYCVRSFCFDSDGSKGTAGPELIIDTEQVGCTPKSEKSCGCTIQ